MEVDDVAVALSVPLVKDLLHLQERLLRDQCLVPPDVELPLVAVHPGVVRVAQDTGQSAVADWPFRPRRRCPSGESLLLHQTAELADGILPCGVLLESPRNELAAFRVDVDGVDKASAEILANVEVAELGPADGAALLDLVRHLDFDVLAVHSDLDFVHDVGDSFHCVRHVPVAKFLLGGHQPHTFLEEFALRDRRIGEVTEDARAHVDHDVLHLGVFVEVAQHLLELGAFRDGLRGLTRLDELAHHCCLECVSFTKCLDALGGDAVAVFVKVGGGVELAWCRNT
nr:hypothetical protein [Cryobacterium lyxosi]